VPLPPQLEHFPVAPQSKHPVIIDITGSFWSGPANTAWCAIWEEALRDRGAQLVGRTSGICAARSPLRGSERPSRGDSRMAAELAAGVMRPPLSAAGWQPARFGGAFPWRNQGLAIAARVLKIPVSVVRFRPWAPITRRTDGQRPELESLESR
jgi:hypothetical protein